jgi:hypothetical protein
MALNNGAAAQFIEMSKNYEVMIGVINFEPAALGAAAQVIEIMK